MYSDGRTSEMKECANGGWVRSHDHERALLAQMNVRKSHFQVITKYIYTDHAYAEYTVLRDGVIIGLFYSWYDAHNCIDALRREESEGFFTEFTEVAMKGEEPK